MGCVIAGFHRSGTSSITQHLVSAGMVPGHDLIGASASNPYGHFEDWVVVRFHDAALRRSGGLDWASVVDHDLRLDEDELAFTRQYCADRQADGAPWGFKDPRVCQFLPDWMEANPALVALIVFRSPAECSWSVYRRTISEFVTEAMPMHILKRILSEPDHALKLWLTHNRTLLDVAKRWPDRCLVVSHAAFTGGFNIAAALEAKFRLGLKPKVAVDTLDLSVLTRDVPRLPVRDRALADETFAVWRGLARLDMAAVPPMERDDLFVDDPEGLRLTVTLQGLEVNELRKQVEYARGRTKQEAAEKIARKLQRWPFRLYFMKSRKYRTLIEEIQR